MPREKEASVGPRTSIREIKAQLELLTAKLKEYENARCSVGECNFVSDGLRLSQEVEILRRQKNILEEENRGLKQQLASYQRPLGEAAG